MQNNVRSIMLEGLVGDDLEFPSDGGVSINNRCNGYMFPPLRCHFYVSLFQEVPVNIACNIVMALGVFRSR
eukprot:2832046-Ditylum_brightwellii.AAC.1